MFDLQNLLPTGIHPLDDFLRGGIPFGKVTHVYGVAGSGKTTLVLQLAVVVANQGSKVVYIDSGRQFSSERLQQMCGTNFEPVGSNIIVIQPQTFFEQSEIIDRLELFVRKDVHLVVVDSLTSLYRKALTKDKERTVVYHQELNRQIAVLLDLAAHHKIPLVLTNQVTEKPDTPATIPVAPSILRYWEYLSIHLELESKPPIGVRQLTLTKGEEKFTIKLIITDKGLLPYEPDTTE